ncbi:MAG: hypothetical protein AAF495_17150 [Pseudomonadota bacterium]
MAKSPLFPRGRLVAPAFAALLLGGGLTSGCLALAVGAGAGAGGYEAYQASEMDQLEQDYKAGKISRSEYEARKDQIDRSSVFQ